MATNLNKRLAHSTTTRWTVKGPTMKYFEDRFPEVEKLIGGFEAALPPESRTILEKRTADFKRRDAACWPNG